jgi:hypothetical protein
MSTATDTCFGCPARDRAPTRPASISSRESEERESVLKGRKVDHAEEAGEDEDDDVAGEDSMSA